LPYEKIECGIFKYEDIGITLPEKYIVVSNGVDVWHKGIRQTKSWEHDEWERLVKLLDYPVVQVGTKYDQHIEGVIDLRQYTTIQQLLSLLKKATAIICTEGGLMHLGNAVGNPNVFVLRGPTSGYLFSYPEQYKIDTRICQPCYWDNGEWYRECPKGLDNVCMKSIKAERVYGVIKGVLDEPLAEVSNITQLLVDDSVFGTTESVTEAYAGV
jgi:ADP-heptose:LPS heptosyltransferase